MKRSYHKIYEHYEKCLEKHGDNHKGVDWPNEEDAKTRYAIMLDLVKNPEEKNSILDFGCGAAHFLDYLLHNKINNIEYAGLDISSKFVNLSRKKYPEYHFICIDLLKNPENFPIFDYIVMNGVFTEKNQLTYEEMWNFFTKMLKTIKPHFRKGLAFNVMSKQVDWERDDLFHVSFDELARFLIKAYGRNFIFRNDYGLYEYTTYIYK